ncbi:MAG: FtsH protease activity modulator HflK [Candidatus Eisenbacteria bacterium]|nr:FtsH protease activity modulator HflK [Candidatus Eisenbacteria bacterium]
MEEPERRNSDPDAGPEGEEPVRRDDESRSRRAATTSVKSDMSEGLRRLRGISRLAALAVVAMYLLSGIYVVQPDERGVVRRFGRVVRESVAPGIHYRIPWPVDAVDTPQVTSIKRMSVGYKIVDRLRGISPEAREAQFVTGDENIMEIQLLIQYVVKSPTDFLFACEEPHWLVRKVGESVLTEKVGTMPVEDVLTTARVEIATTVKERAQRVLDRYGAGIEIVAAHLQETNPPREVADAFREVASAREDRNRIVQEAEGYLNRVVPTARGEAAGLVESAEGYGSEKVARAEGEAARFTAVFAEYRNAPTATRERLYLEALEKVLENVRKYVLDPREGDSTLDLRFLTPNE